MIRINRCDEVRAALRSLSLVFFALSIAILPLTHAAAQAPAASEGAAAPMSEADLAKLVGPIALYPDDLVAIILPASTNPLQLVQADRFLEKRKSDPEASDRRQVGRPREVAAQLSRRREEDERRSRLDDGAGRSGRDRPGRSHRSGAGLSPQGAGRGQPQVRRQAGGEGREGNRHHPARGSASDLRAAVQPDDRGRAKRAAGLLPDALSVLLLPVSARRRARDGRDLGRRHRRGVERQSLWLLRRREHQRQPQHQHQHEQRQPWRRRGWRHGVEIEQATGAGERRRRAGAHRARVRAMRVAAQARAGCGCGRRGRRGTRVGATGECRTRGGGGGDALGGYGSGRQAQADSSRGAQSRSSMSGRRCVGECTLDADWRRRRIPRWWRWWWRSAAAVVAAVAAAAAAGVDREHRHAHISLHRNQGVTHEHDSLVVVPAPACAGPDRGGSARGGRGPAANLRDAGGGGRRVHGRAQGRQRSGHDRDLRRGEQRPHRPIGSRGHERDSARKSSRPCRRSACCASRARIGACS